MSSQRLPVLLAVLLVTSARWPLPARGAPAPYRLLPLAPVNLQPYGLALNARRQVVGQFVREGKGRPFVWRPATGLRELRTPGWEQGRAVAINEKGEAAGIAWNAGGLNAAVAWDAAGTLRVLSENAEAAGINDSGTVCGCVYQSPALLRQACVWRGAEREDLPGLGGPESCATALNAREDVVGWADTATSERRRAVLYRNGKLTPLAGAGLDDSAALAINEAGQVTGRRSQFPFHGFFWSAGRARDLGPRVGWSVNARGQVGCAGQRKGLWIWDRGRLTDLTRRVRLPAGWRFAVWADSGPQLADDGTVLLNLQRQAGRRWVPAASLLVPMRKE